MKHFKQTFELALRLYVCAMMGIYGLGKIGGGQFYRPGQLPESVAQKSLSQLSGFDVAWAFFGYSTTYIWFIGLSQVVGGLLLLHPRTKLFGVAVLLPLLLNIIIVDACFSISAGAQFTAVFSLLALGLVLWLNRVQVLAAVQAIWGTAILPKSTRTSRLLQAGVAMGLTVLLMMLEFTLRSLLA